MKYVFALMILLAVSVLKGQDLISSSTGIETCLDQHDCSTINSVSYLFYDESRNEFFLKVDFSHFRAEADSLNRWIDDMLDSTLYFRAILPKESFPPLSNQNTKTLRLNGEIYFNDIVREQSVDLTLYNTENSLVISGNNNMKYDAYKVNFSVPVVAKDFKVYNQLFYVNQTIAINVTLGRINLLRPGMEFHLKEVYYQRSR